MRIDNIGGDDADTDRARDVNAEHEKSDEVEKSCPDDRITGRSMRVETRVAIEFAVSCRPLRKSNASATTIRPINRGRLSSAAMLRFF